MEVGGKTRTEEKIGRFIKQPGRLHIGPFIVPKIKHIGCQNKTKKGGEPFNQYKQMNEYVSIRDTFKGNNLYIEYLFLA